MRKEKLITQLLFGGLALLLPLAFFVYFLVSERSEQLEETNLELAGVRYISGLRPLLHALPHVRGLTMLKQSGEGNLAERLGAVRDQVDAAFARLEDEFVDDGTTLKIHGPILALYSEWRRISAKSVVWSPQEVFRQYTSLLEQLVTMVKIVGDNSRLVLDPDTDAYHLMILVVERLPRMIEDLGQLRGISTAAARRGDVLKHFQNQIIGTIARLRQDEINLNYAVRTAVDADPAIAKAISRNLADFETQLNQFLLLTAGYELWTQGSSRTATEIYQTGTKTVDMALAMFDVVLPELERLLQARSQRAENQMHIAIAVIVIATFIAAISGYLFLVSFTSSLREEVDLQTAKVTENARHLQLLQHVTKAANQSTSIEDALQFCLDEICWFIDWPLGHVLLVDKTALNGEIYLKSSNVWHLDDPQSYPDFRAASEILAVEPGRGLANRVFRHGEPAWIPDVNEDRHFVRTSANVNGQLKGAFAFPFLVGDRVVAIAEFFSDERQEPDQAIMDLARDLGTQMGRIVERHFAAEGLVKAKTAAESANQAKSEFLSTMSHELRTPLNAIIGFGQILAKRAQRESDDKGARQTEAIINGGRHLLRMIDQVLQFSDLQDDAQAIKLEPVKIPEIVDMCLSGKLDQAKKFNVELANKLDGQSLPPTLSEPGRLKKALDELLSNAIIYGGGGTVSVRAEMSVEGRVRILVSDNGPGIDTAYHRAIFEPFKRIVVNEVAADGAGLGLAFAEKLVIPMGGKIDFETSIGNGSTFWIELPIAGYPPTLIDVA